VEGISAKHIKEECGNCRLLRGRLQGLLARNRALVRSEQKARALLARAEDRIRELEQIRRPTASNSSIAPSSNPIGAKPPVVKKPTGRKPGGQLGHVGKGRTLLAVEKMDRVVRHRPKLCEHCYKPLEAGCVEQLVGRHQVAELPVQAVELTEHQSYACRCTHCQKVTRGMIPAEIAVSATGPRLTAAIGVLGSWVKGSRRAVAEVVGQTLGCPIALGSIIAREAELTDALAQPYQALASQLSTAAVKYVDETGWKLHGAKRTLFVAAGEHEALFKVEPTRTRPAFMRLLDEKTLGVICTDRCGIYDAWPEDKRQLCWAHLKRDFVAAIERGGAGEQLAQQALEITGTLFKLYRDFKNQRLTRTELIEQIEPLKKQMHKAMLLGAACGQKKTAGLFRSLLKREPALWRFADTPGVDPTNNLAERMLRPAVIWRKKSFGCHSRRGCQYVERMLSVIQTLRLRNADVLGYLAAAVDAHRQGVDPPNLPTPQPPSIDTADPKKQPLTQLPHAYLKVA
jgi:transposase